MNMIGRLAYNGIEIIKFKQMLQITEKLANEILEQLKGAQSDCYVQDTQDVINELQKQLKNCNFQSVNASFLPKCTRVEVIDQSGRAYVNWKPTNKVQMQMQDYDKTLKIFIT